MTQSNFDDVGDFHEKFGLANTTHHAAQAFPVTVDMLRFRLKFIEEEFGELIEGLNEQDAPKVFDALLDLVYVAMGTAHILGFPWQEGWNAVQAANMTKVRANENGSNSTRKSKFDVVKPEGWQPPDIAGILEDHGWGSWEKR